MKESDVQVITQEEIDGVIDSVHKAIGRFCSHYDRGILAEDDRNTRVANVFWDEAIGFFKNKSLRIRINAGDWTKFTKEIAAWRSDGENSHLQACSWLFFFREDESRGIKYEDEASVPDKIKVLKLLDACHVPIEYYRPVPEGIVCPDLHQTGNWGEYCVGFEIWEQDDGLVQGDCRIGERKTLIDHYGLKTEILIEQHPEEHEKNRYRNGDYIGTGTIEGYTSSRPRTIQVDINHKRSKISGLRFYMENDDYQLDFPLWKEYNKDRAEIGRIYEKIISDLIDEHSIHRR